MGRITRVTSIGTSNINNPPPTQLPQPDKKIDGFRNTAYNAHITSPVTTAPSPQQDKIIDGYRDPTYDPRNASAVTITPQPSSSLHDIQFGGKGSIHTMNLSPEAVAWYEKEAPKTIVKKNTISGAGSSIIANEIFPTISSPHQFSIKDYDTGVVRTTNVVSPISDKGGIQASYDRQSFAQYQNKIQKNWYDGNINSTTYNTMIQTINQNQHLTKAQKSKLLKQQEQKKQKYSKVSWWGSSPETTPKQNPEVFGPPTALTAGIVSEYGSLIYMAQTWQPPKKNGNTTIIDEYQDLGNKV
jgi:hypothetical protein